MKFSEYEKKQGSSKKEKPDRDIRKELLGVLSKFDGKSEDEIISAIMEIAEKSRKQGRLSDEEVDSFVKTLAPMIDGEKRKKLNEVAGLIKTIKPD